MSGGAQDLLWGFLGPNAYTFPRQLPVVSFPRPALLGAAVRPLVSGPGRSALSTMASMCAVALSCLTSGCCQLLIASQGTSWARRWVGKSGFQGSVAKVQGLRLGLVM